MEIHNENNSAPANLVSFHYTDIELYSEYIYHILDDQQQLTQTVAFFYHFGQPLHLHLHRYAENVKISVLAIEMFDTQEFHDALGYLEKRLISKEIFAFIKNHISSYVSFAPLDAPEAGEPPIIIQNELNKTIVRPRWDSFPNLSPKACDYDSPNLQKRAFEFRSPTSFARNHFVVYYQLKPFYAIFNITIDGTTHSYITGNRKEFDNIFDVLIELSNKTEPELKKHLFEIYNNIGMLQFFGPTPNTSTSDLNVSLQMSNQKSRIFNDIRIRQVTKRISETIELKIPDSSEKLPYKKLILLQHFVGKMSKQIINNPHTKEYNVLEQLDFLRCFLFASLYNLAREIPIIHRKSALSLFINQSLDLTGLNEPEKQQTLTLFFDEKNVVATQNRQALANFTAYFPEETAFYHKQLQAISEPERLMHSEISISTPGNF